MSLLQEVPAGGSSETNVQNPINDMTCHDSIVIILFAGRFFSLFSSEIGTRARGGSEQNQRDSSNGWLFPTGALHLIKIVRTTPPQRPFHSMHVIYYRRSELTRVSSDQRSWITIENARGG